MRLFRAARQVQHLTVPRLQARAFNKPLCNSRPKARGEEIEGFMKDWMPVLVERQIDGMPEKRKRMAVIVCSQMLPRIG